MDSFYLILLALIILFIIPYIKKKRKNIAIKHILDKKKKNKENDFMKELIKDFIGKECMVYTIISDNSSINGILKEIKDDAILIDSDGNLQVVNLEYVIRIRKWPLKKNGKKKEIVLD